MMSQKINYQQRQKLTEVKLTLIMNKNQLRVVDPEVGTSAFSTMKGMRTTNLAIVVR